MRCALECGASQLTAFHHHSSYLMSDCLRADKIKLQASLISATGVFSLSHNNMRDRGFQRLLRMIMYSGLPILLVYHSPPTCRGGKKEKDLTNYDSWRFSLNSAHVKRNVFQDEMLTLLSQQFSSSYFHPLSLKL